MTTATFDNVKQTLLKVTEEKEGPSNLYIFLHVFSQVALNIMHGDFSLESIKKITLPDGDPAFDDEFAQKIHEVLTTSGDTIKNTLNLIQHDMQFEGKQQGGGPDVRNKILETLKTLRDNVNLDYLSVDGLYYKLTNFLDKLDEQNRVLSQELGVSKFMNSVPQDPTVAIPTPAGVPIVLKAPIRIFPVLINGIIEIIRLCIALNVLPLPDFIDNLLGFAQASLDVARGRWKYGVLTLLGTMSNQMYFVTLILKLIRDVWTLIEPNLANQLRDNLFLSGKSIFVGFILRVFSIVAPDFIRAQFNTLIAPVNELYTRINEKLEQLEVEANKVAEPAGMIVTFPRVGQNEVITLDDIQSLQTIFSVPEIGCSNEIQAIIKGSQTIPPLRLLFEMMNLPVSEEAISKRCQSLSSEPITETMVKMMKPDIKLIPGGPMNMEEKQKAVGIEPTAESALGLASGLLSGGPPSLGKGTEMAKGLLKGGPPSLAKGLLSAL